MNNFYFDDTNVWRYDRLGWQANVVDNVVHHPTEERLFYRGKNPNPNPGGNPYLNQKHSIYSFYYTTSGWINEDLGINYSIDDVASDIVVSPIDGKQIYYRNKYGFINYFEKNGIVWDWFNASNLPNALENVIHSPLQSKVLYYLALGNFVYELNYHNGNWLTSQISPSNNAASDLIHSPIGQGERLFYKGIDNKIYMLKKEPVIGWKLDCLNDLAGLGAIPGNVQGYLAHSPNSLKIYYVDFDNRLCNFYFDGTAWRHGCLDLTVTNVEASKYCISESGRKIYYKGTDGKLHLFYFLNDRWYARSMQFEGSNNVAGNIVVNSNDKPFYIGTDGGVWNYYEKRSGNYDWIEEDISID